MRGGACESHGERGGGGEEGLGRGGSERGGSGGGREMEMRERGGACAGITRDGVTATVVVQSGQVRD